MPEPSMKILLLDNRDSFTYNLAEAFRKLGKNNVNIETADSLDLDDVAFYDKIIFSPGPGLPSEHPVMAEILNLYGRNKSILGVCLGMQAIAVFFGASLFNLTEIIHGHGSGLNILLKDHYLFKGIPDKTGVGLYHSWAVSQTGFPDCLQVSSLSEEGIIMSLHHETYDITGVQFHPESVITKDGLQILSNWINH